MQAILYKNELVPQELLDFLEVKHFHTANKICGFRYVLHLWIDVITVVPCKCQTCCDEKHLKGYLVVLQCVTIYVSNAKKHPYHQFFY